MGPPVAEIKGADGQKLASGDYNENAAGCCQGVNGVSCCRNASFEENKGIEKTQGSNWPVLQKRPILSAGGILGALAAVTVAHRFFRRSG